MCGLTFPALSGRPDREGARLSAVWWFLYAQFLVVLFAGTAIISLLAKTHAKAAQTKTRVDALIGVAKTANQLSPLTANVTTLNTLAGNATALNSLAGNTLLASLNQEAAPSTFGGPASNSNANLFSWAGDATARFNQIYSIMQGTGLWS
jgi:hypothetical protein